MASRTARTAPRLTARTADKHVLYTRAVQDVEAEIDFVDETFKRLRGRRASRLREDFCGTAATSCEWARRRPTNVAVGLDLDRATLDWGLAHNVAKLPPSAARRVRLLERNVLDPGPGTSRMDAILAMNFSYFVFRTRDELRRYFRAARDSLVRDGVLFMDIYGGYEAAREQRERRVVAGPGGRFTYIWHQARFEPISHRYLCHIHFAFPDGSRINRAFTYEWRLWSIPEVRELLAEAGFRRSTVYWEGDDGRGGGDGDFKPVEEAEQCASFIAYIVAER